MAAMAARQTARTQARTRHCKLTVPLFEEKRAQRREFDNTTRTQHAKQLSLFAKRDEQRSCGGSSITPHGHGMPCPYNTCKKHPHVGADRCVRPKQPIAMAFRADTPVCPYKPRETPTHEHGMQTTVPLCEEGRARERCLRRREI